MEITMVCPCRLGREGLVKDELLYLEAQNIRPQNGRVVFQGGPEILARDVYKRQTLEISFY